MNTYLFNFAAVLTGIFLLAACQQNDATDSDEIIHTVNGPVGTDELNFALTHEHVMSNFGEGVSDPSQYDETELFDQVIPYLRKLESLGVDTIFDCTPKHLGRRVDLLQQFADSTGIQIITNTGFYGAMEDRYVPEFAFDASVEELSKIWIEEFEEGIDDSGIRPGFVKLAFDEGMPSEIDTKLFEAGVITHLDTGLTLVVHTVDNPEAAEVQLQLLEEYEVSPEAWVWTHAHAVSDNETLLETASKGAWIALDGVNSSNVEEIIDRLEAFKSEDLLHRVLLSHDGDGYPAGGEIRPFEAIPQELIPAMREKGFTDEDIDQLMIENPKEAYTIRIRKTD